MTNVRMARATVPLQTASGFIAPPPFISHIVEIGGQINFCRGDHQELARAGPPTIRFMYELAIQRIFSAAHQITIRGELEPLHGHDWRLTVVIGGDALDEDGLLVDFHDLERVVDDVIEPFRNANLNATPPFDKLNPTAERVAEHIGRELITRFNWEHARLLAVRLTEAPGCETTWRAG